MTPKTLTKEQWLAMHRDPGIVSASQIFTATGENPHESPYTLWARKTGRAPWQEKTLAMRRGHALEPLCAELYTENTGRELRDLGDYTVVQHPDYPWLVATPDRLMVDGELPVEFKTSRNFKEWIIESPLGAQVQLQIQMACLAKGAGSIGAFISGFLDDFLTYDFTRHDRLINGLIEVAIEFRERCLNDDPPPVDGSESTTKTLRLMHPESEPGKVILLPREFDAIGARLERVKGEIKDLEEEEKFLENTIKAQLEDAEIGETESGQRWSYKSSVRKGYEVKETTVRTLRKLKGKENENLP